ncbi:MAG: DUF4019 domain-containing protein [Verrucomicrobiota bacterium]
MYWKNCLSLLFIAIGGTLTSLAAPTAEIEAKEAAARWLKVIDQHEYGEAWARCAPYFRTQIEREAFVSGLEEARTPVGKPESRKLTRLFYTTTLPQAPMAHYVVIQFETKFEGREEPIIETITPMLIDANGDPVSILENPTSQNGTWLISGYYFQ